MGTGSKICFVGLSLIVSIAAPAEERFLLGVKTSLLREMFHQSISESTPISEYVKGTWMKGTALTSGMVTAEPFLSADGIGISLILSSVTDAYTLNTNVPRPDIGIAFNWTILTQATTRKNLLLRESGIALWNAESWAQSAITIHALNVSAEGLFWRLKTRVAQRKAWETLLATKAENEAQAAQKIAGELSGMVDKKTYETLTPLHEKYYTYFYNPLVRDGLLGGRLAMGSNQSWIAIQGVTGNAVPSLSVSSIPGLERSGERASIVIRVSAAFLEHVATERFGGTELTEVEAAEMLGKKASPAETMQNVLGSATEEILMRFEEQRPLEVAFEPGNIHLVFRLSQLTTLGKTVQRVRISRDLPIRTSSDGKIFLGPVHGIEVSDYENRPLDLAFALHIRNRITAGLSKEPIELSKSILLEQTKPMSVQLLESNSGSLTVGLSPVKR